MGHFPVFCRVAVTGVSCWDPWLVVRASGEIRGQLVVVG